MLKELLILPLKDTVVFPYALAPLVVKPGTAMEAIKKAMLGDHLIGLVTQKRNTEEITTVGNLYEIGTLGRIVKTNKDKDDKTTKVLIEGLRRIKIHRYIKTSPYITAMIEEIRPSFIPTQEDQLLLREVKENFRQFIEINHPFIKDFFLNLEEEKDIDRLTDTITTYLNLSLTENQEFLQTISPQERLQKIFTILDKQLQIIKYKDQLKSKLSKKLSQRERDFILQQEMEVIQQELGEKSDTKEAKEIREKLKKAKPPTEVMELAEKELERLSKAHSFSPEHSVILDYLTWLSDVPWSNETKDQIDIKKAAKILDDDHYGLEEVKERILEYLAVYKLKREVSGAILCFVGPPGTGKTSLGKSIARTLDRKFIRFSLGGMHDEAEIRGHRRTYVGAMPGKIIQQLKKTGVRNPVFMLDEIDKIGKDFRGDPASALLEVLDPQQNKEFQDLYLDVPFDLSKCLFITTANILDTIPHPLLDRMEVIRLSGYSEEEKLEIAKKYLVPRQLEENGLDKRFKITMPDKILQKIIKEYTLEAGLRNLERTIGQVFRKISKEALEKDEKVFVLNEKKIENYLGPPRNYHDQKLEKDEVGVVNGLAWTPCGGELLVIESSKMKGKRGLKLTGKLGDVMQESAETALSYVRTNAKKFKIDEAFFDKYDIHIHVPSGAIPKDGPSAGITIATSLISLLTGKKTDHNTAMTGEITLQGRVLPIGGLKEKVLAARRAGIRKIILPAENIKDLKDVPLYVQKDLKFVPAKHIEDVIRESLKIG